MNELQWLQAVEIQFQLDPASVPEVPHVWKDDSPVKAREAVDFLGVLRLFYAAQDTRRPLTPEEVLAVAKCVKPISLAPQLPFHVSP